MDKSKFTANPHLDSEGFVMYGPPHYLGELTDNLREDRNGPWVTPRSFHAMSAALLKHGAVTLRNDEYTIVDVNPPGWNEPGMQPITWADENPHTTTVDVKRLCAEVLLRGHA